MTGAGPPPDGINALAGVAPVSRETGERLQRFVSLLRKWQAAENLVSPNTLGSVWLRHVADSAQLAALFPQARTWLDLGSGAGFPGLVVAALVADRAGAHVHLIESNRRKCAFLRAAIRETEAPATVHEGRIEDVLANWRGAAELVTARALAPLDRLLALAAPALAGDARAAFHKGQDFAREIDEAAKSWEFGLVTHRSRVDDRGVILEVAHVVRRPDRRASAEPDRP